MANRSRWENIKKQRPEPADDTRVGVEQDLALGQLIYDLFVRELLTSSRHGLDDR